MFKEFKIIIGDFFMEERINELIKKSFEIAVRDDEWKLRYLQEWNILFEDIDKMLEYVENGYKGELRVNSNIWWVLQETLVKVLELYDLQLIGEEKVSEDELVVPISRVGNIKEKVFNKMIQYGWNLADNELEDFNNVYNIHKNFLDSCYDFKCKVEEDNEILNMNDISVSRFEDMLDFMTDFLRAFEEVDKER